MPRKEKDTVKDTLYGIRLRTDFDVSIKEKLEQISIEKEIPMDQLILSYIGRVIDINTSEIIKEPRKTFINFIIKGIKEIKKNENKIKMEAYKKKKSLQWYIYQIYPEDLQRNQFFLKLLIVQIKHEYELLELILMTFGYLDYLKLIDNLSNEELKKRSNDLVESFWKKWFYELKLSGIINNERDLIELNFNYKMLERFVFRIYEGKKIKLSEEEKNEMFYESLKLRRIERIERKKKGIKKKKITKQYLYKELNYLFQLSISGDRYDPISFNDFKLKQKIGFKPYILYDVLEIDKFWDFIKEIKQESIFLDLLSQIREIYLIISSGLEIPPSRLISDYEKYIHKHEDLRKILINLGDKINILPPLLGMNLLIYLLLCIDKKDRTISSIDLTETFFKEDVEDFPNSIYFKNIYHKYNQFRPIFNDDLIIFEEIEKKIPIIRERLFKKKAIKDQITFLTGNEKKELLPKIALIFNTLWNKLPENNQKELLDKINGLKGYLDIKDKK